MHDVHVRVVVSVEREVELFGKTFRVVNLVGDEFSDCERVHYACEFVVVFCADCCGRNDIVVDSDGWHYGWSWICGLDCRE